MGGPEAAPIFHRNKIHAVWWNRSLFETNRYRSTVRVQMFHLAKPGDDGDRFTESFPIVADDTGPPLELINGQSAKRFCRTASREHVTRTCQKVTCSDRRKIANKNGARVRD